MTPPEIIPTPRLLLRKPIAPDDALPIFASYAADSAVTRYLPWRPHYNVEESLRILRTRLEWWDEGREYSWVIVHRTARVIVGMVTASGEESATRYDLGYVLAREHWGRGYATEAARAVIDALLALPDVNRICARVDRDNTASMRVLEKAGLQRETLLPRSSVQPAIGRTARDCWSYARSRGHLPKVVSVSRPGCGGPLAVDAGEKTGPGSASALPSTAGAV